MTGHDARELSFDEFDEVRAPRPEPTGFEELVERSLSRRDVLRGTVAWGAAAFIAGAGGLRPARASSSRLSFAPVPASTADTVTLPEGYSWHVVTRWGDPLWSEVPEFDQASRGTGASQERSFGDNNDGMVLFSRGNRHVLLVNNEYANRDILHGNRASKKAETPDDIRKSKAAHGVTVVEVARRQGRWRTLKDSPLNRRITADTPIAISGPARGHDLVKTAADGAGALARGTFNNCGSGRTPWGTYLACEENFNGYFSSSDPQLALSPDQKRYGVGHKDWGYGWAAADERFDIARHPNEPNRAGYVVEIDPWDPSATPRKLTALGRFKHENAEVVLSRSGRVVVYMGDDERGEFLYRYVSDQAYVPGGDPSGLLDNGTLYAARFTDDGRGEWIALTPAATGMATEAEIRIRTRMAASSVGATTMDRPEWVAANPLRNEVYCCLTNNKNRGVKPNAGGDATPVNGANPRKVNHYGQIVRWIPDGGDHTAAGFAWNLFVLAGNPTVHQDEYAGSANVDAGNMFNSPDGLAFDSNGLLWIQTDGNYGNEKDFAGMGNNQMLVADPETAEIRRFMVGPRQAEVTGFAWSPDRATLFVGIQHPGEKGGDSHFPDGGENVPRSCAIAISRDDGLPIG